MPAFTTQSIRPYFDEVQYQVEAFMGALREIELSEHGGVQAEDRWRHHALVFRNAQAMVTAAAQLSKLFWVPAPARDRSERELEILEFGKARSECLRAMFGIDNTSPLKNRDVRNAYEHLDDRLDRTLSQGEPSMIIDRGIGPASGWSVPGKKLIKRFLDPGRAVLTVMNTEVSLPPIVSEMQRLERLLISMKLQGFNPQTKIMDPSAGGR